MIYSSPSKVVVSLAVSMAAATVCMTTEAVAASLTSNSQGWYNELGDSNGSPDTIENTFTGVFEDERTSEALEYRSYFTFDVGSLTSPVQSGMLRLPQEFYFSGAPFEQITIFDVDTPAAVLDSQSETLSSPDTKVLGSTGGGAAETITGSEIFQDLGSGAQYGTGIFQGTPGWNPATGFIELALTSAAINDINAARQISAAFSFGVALTSINQTPFSVEGIGAAEGVRFSSSFSPRLAELHLEEADSATSGGTKSVPEPLTGLGTLAAATFFVRLRRYSGRS